MAPISTPAVTDRLAGKVAFPRVTLDAASLDLLSRLFGECAAAVFVGRVTANHGTAPMTEDERISIMNLLKDKIGTLPREDRLIAAGIIRMLRVNEIAKLKEK